MKQSFKIIAFPNGNLGTREPKHWRYSSARNYEGMEGLLEVCTDWSTTRREE